MPSAELPNLWQGIAERGEEWAEENKSPAQREHERREREFEGVPAEQLCAVSQEFELGGRRYRLGQKLRRSDPVVRAHPEWFSSVPVPLLELEPGS